MATIRPGLSDDMAAAVAAGDVRNFPLVYMDLDSGALRLTGLPFDLAASVSPDGEVWTSARGWGSFKPIEESADEMAGIEFTLSGVPPGVVAEALTEKIQGRLVTVMWVVVEPGGALRYDENAWSGKLDVMRVERSAGTSVITVTAEHAMLDWSRPRTRYFNDADQKRVDPADNFCRLGDTMAEKNVVLFSKAVQKAHAKREAQ